MEIEAVSLEQNNAPLLDILFNLLIFFIFACEASVQENVKLNTPKVIDPQATAKLEGDQVSVSLITADDNKRNVQLWRIADESYTPAQFASLQPGKAMSGRDDLRNRLRSAMAAGRSPDVTLRAEETIEYRHVHQAMGTITEIYMDLGATDAKINLAIRQGTR